MRRGERDDVEERKRGNKTKKGGRRKWGSGGVTEITFEKWKSVA